MNDVTDYERKHVYFCLSSKYQEATLSIDHWEARQSPLLPWYPDSAINEALPLLDECAAHYVREFTREAEIEWHRDATFLTVPASHLPRGIAPGENADQLLAIARRHAGGPEAKAWMADVHFRALREIDGEPHPSNVDEFESELIFWPGIQPCTCDSA